MGNDGARSSSSAGLVPRVDRRPGVDDLLSGQQVTDFSERNSALCWPLAESELLSGVV